MYFNHGKHKRFGKSQLFYMLVAFFALITLVTVATISSPRCIFFHGPCLATYYSVVQVGVQEGSNQVENRENLTARVPVPSDVINTADLIGRDRRDLAIDITVPHNVVQTSLNARRRQSNLTAIYGVPDYVTIGEALASHASYDTSTGTSTIVLSSIDSGYVEMALNLWESSFVRFNITNFLFVCSDAKSQIELAKSGLPCFRGLDVKGSDKASVYGSSAFRRKTHLKTNLTLDALSRGYHVLLMDVDIVMLKNPFPYFSCSECDIEVQSDGPEINSGFLFARPTPASIQLHSIALGLASRNPNLSNQKTLAKALETLEKAGVINVKIFNKYRFPRGFVFFEQGHRMFMTDRACRDCVIVHNNWIQSEVAKVYRFKEFGMWVVDKDGYYSNPNTKYLTFENALDIPRRSKMTDLENLRTGLRLGALLNRTLILPTFHCHGCKFQSCKNVDGQCSLNTYINMNTFERYFNGTYREHVFLHHPKVPSSVANSQSETLLILSNKAEEHLNDQEFRKIRIDTVFTPADKANGANSTEILKWLEPYQHYSVIRFHSLYDAFLGFSDAEKIQFDTLERKLRKGMKSDNYRQN